MTVSASFESTAGQTLRGDLPVCTGRSFRETVEPIADRLGLYLISGWNTVTEITRENSAEFTFQLKLLLASINSEPSVGQDERKYLSDRLESLLAEIDEAFRVFDDVIVTIG